MSGDKLFANLWLGFIFVASLWAAYLTMDPFHHHVFHKPLGLSVANAHFTDGHGTAFYIGHGNFITAAHVASHITPDDPLVLTFENGKVFKASVVWMDAETDVALLKADGDLSTVPAVSMACNKPDAAIGDRLTSIGYPVNLGYTQTWGRMATKVGLPIHAKQAVVDMTIAPGSSGGPMFDADGDVAGIVDAMPVVSLSETAATLLTYAIIVPRSVVCASLNTTHDATIIPQENKS